MAKQKVVLKVSMGDAKKRSRALRIAVGLPGVVSAALDNDRLIVIGDGVDTVELATVLRRKMGGAELVSVGSAEENKKEEKKSPAVEESDKNAWQPTPAISWTTYPAAPPPYNNYHYRYPYEITQADREDNCSIM
ncbi:heavy metal-associated isoprenylated plant protein 47-like [Zingiber officinale]|uniref:HMA domain-containing protein n=1 Tax=Zingiber officinale TaxID=94328 RepID=A0A8J5LBQ5_ZINOF|nr:heavy metal-associated isoprenylated plant protein 47-like [Zingiber officinale]KAG6507637.1 hypothetical protein ZIOFF_032988 [Zingiber officinale]